MAETGERLTALSRWGTLAVAAFAFAAYALACAPTPYLLDSAALAQTSFGLGIAHPPGEPLSLLWGKLFCLLPLGSVAFRVGLSQAFAGAVAAAFLFRIGLRVLGRLDDGGALGAGTRVVLAAAAALGFAFAPGAIIVADRPEVYAVQTALSLAALLAALRCIDDEDPRLLLVAALLIGLGLGNHPLVAGLAGLGACVAALPVLRARLVGWSVGALIAGALVLAYLPVRAYALAAHPDPDLISWGDARSLSGFLWVISAKTFAAKAGIVHTAADPTDLPFVLMEELEVALALLAPAGAFFLMRRRALRLPGAVVLVAWAGSAVSALNGGFNAQNPDIRGYLGVAIALTALLATIGIAVLLVWFGRPRLRPALAVLLLAGALTRFPSGNAYPGLRQAAAADTVAGRLLGELPVRATLLTAYYETAFLVGYQRLVEGRRPDIAWAHLGFAASPGYTERIARTEPELGDLLTAHRRQPLQLEVVSRLPRPLRMEADDHVSPALRAALAPAGLTWGLKPAEDSPLPPWIRAEAQQDRQVLGFLAFRGYLDAQLACDNGFRAVAAERLALVLDLLPRDQQARALQARCPAP